MAETVYRIAAFNAYVSGNGGLGALGVQVYAFAKHNDKARAPYLIANETICSHLGRAIRLPFPASEIVTGGNPPIKYFASLDFNNTGNSLPPIVSTQCVEKLPDLSTGLLLFDILVANLDRHANNINIDMGAQPPQMTAFDHSHALFGYIPNQGEARLKEKKDRLGISWRVAGQLGSGPNRHCLLDVINSDAFFDKWVKRIKTIPDFLIEEVCLSAVELGLTFVEAQCAVDFLSYRRDHLDEIINANRTDFTGIKTWSIFRQRP